MIKKLLLVLGLSLFSSVSFAACTTKESVAEQITDKYGVIVREVSEQGEVIHLKSLLVEMSNGSATIADFEWDLIQIFETQTVKDKLFVVFYRDSCVIKAGWFDKQITEGLLLELDRGGA